MENIEKMIIAKSINLLCDECGKTAKNHGWRETERNIFEVMALIHSELGEATEALRCNKQSDHIPKFLGIEEELADVLIRIFDVCGERGYRLADALMEKMKFNKTRPYRHGGKIA